MSIPVALTTISVLVPDADADPYEDRVETTVTSGVRATFSNPGGSDRIVGGEQEIVDMRLSCDPCEMPYTAIVVDESTAERWAVVWVRSRVGLGLDHMEAGVRRVQGAAA